MKLNALLKTLGFLALAATPAVAGTAPAPKNPIAPAPENDDLGINASLGYDTNYIFRGVNMGQHWVRAAVDGSILLLGGAGEDAGNTYLNWDVQFGTFAGDQDHFAGVAQQAVIGGDTTLSFQRLQVGAAFVHDFGPASVSLGYRYFRNMGELAQQTGVNGLFGFGGNGFGMQDAQEVQLGLSTSVGPIDIASSANWDWIGDGWYFDLTASTTVAITDAISFVPSFNVGYAKNYSWQNTPASANVMLGGGAGLPFSASNSGDDLTGWAAANISFAFPIKLNSRATLTPYIAANLPMGALSDVGPAWGNNPNAGAAGPDNAFQNIVYGGVTLSIRF